MQVYNTKIRSQVSNFETAVFQGLAEDGGLFMPQSIPVLPTEFLDELPGMSFPEMAFQLSRMWIGDELSVENLRKSCFEAFSFPVPLRQLDDRIFTLELFHGPSLAFKDFGARWMSRIIGCFLERNHKPLHVLVATSGDTGGAVAMGFWKVPGIEVTILFPKGRVSAFQEYQLTGLGENIQAIEVEGSFDDCQHLVKAAFSDKDLSKKIGLTSANSINLARLIPQSFYYFQAWATIQKVRPGGEVVVSVPSGNFGNICAGAFALAMGLPIKKLVASVNANRVFPDYLKDGKFKPSESVATLSNAMDVGNPSNFARILALFETHEKIKTWISSFSYTDSQTILAMEELWNQYGYLSEPHAAVGYLGLKEELETSHHNEAGIFLGTAHPAKFLDTLPESLRQHLIIPQSLMDLEKVPKAKTTIKVDYEILKSRLVQSSH